MKVTVVYSDKFNLPEEVVTLQERAMLIELFIHLVQKYDRSDFKLFGTTDIRLGKTVNAKINGKIVLNLEKKLKNNDRVELS